MNGGLDLEELVSRYAAIVVCYYHFARTWKDWAAIVAKIRALSLEAEEMEVSIDSIRPLLLVELSDRFDPETARRLTRELSDLIAAVSAPSPAMAGHR